MAAPKIKNQPDCMMISLRNIRVANTLGACVWFTPNEPVLVPGCLVDDAAAKGCVPVDSAEYESHRERMARLANEQEALKEKLIAATEVMVRRNNFEEFTSTGHPKVSVLADEVGVDPKEISDQMRDYAFSEWSSRNRRSLQSRKTGGKPEAKVDETKV